jgi:hypothetical protein
VLFNLKIINDVSKHQNKVRASIKKYGHFAEHNLGHYLYSEGKKEKNIMFDYGRDKTVLTQYDSESKVWNLFPNGILAPENERFELLLQSAYYILKERNAKKFSVEVSEDLKRLLRDKFKIRNGIRACNYTYVLYWPLYNMRAWDTKLKGSRWKKLRNLKNSLYRKNNVRVVDSKNVPKEKLRGMIDSWLRRRRDNDFVDKDYYLNLIDNGFKGVDIAKTIYVNGKPCTISAGWKIPNSNNYYSSIGILDYSYAGLGEVANIDELNRLKKEGYEYVDFGGSDKVLLSFKKKFKPEKIYKTYLFSIVRT